VVTAVIDRVPGLTRQTPLAEGTTVSINSSSGPAETQTMFQALTEAAAIAGHAPSIHNTQPWRWQVTGDRLDLHLERGRVLDITDPDARLATLSCGAALHHARVSLAAQGWRATVTRLPDPADPDHLASLQVSGEAPVPVEPLTVRRAQTIGQRHTDRRPLTGPSVGLEQLDTITVAVEAEGASLHILNPEQMLDLAAAAGHAQRAEAGDTAWQTEMDYWIGGTRPTGTGIPDAAIPWRATRTTVPGRDFGHRGDLPVSTRHDRSAKFAILYGSGDQPQDWLHAGEALSAAWLTATELGVCVLPLSATIEMIGTRQAMRVLLASVGFPYLVLRLGTNDPSATAPPRAPRLRSEQFIGGS
jgi:nitroreductase